MSHPRVEEVSDSDFDSDPDVADIDDFNDRDIMRRVEPQAVQPAIVPPPQQAPRPAQQAPNVPQGTIPAGTDTSQFKGFACIYPVYFDASRSRAEGRRVGEALAVKNPLAREIATACSRLRLQTLLEPEKTHPKDWSNPGRVKVDLKNTPNTTIKNKHHLYVLIAQHLKENPTTEDSAGLRVRINGKLEPEQGKPYPRAAVPRGWKVNDLVPYMSAAMTGGGVSENLFKDMMGAMQGGADPMAALMGAQQGGGGGGGSGAGSGSEEPTKKEKKNKKGKGKA